MKLYLLRHGIAVEGREVGGNDSARTLTAEGREKVLQATQSLRRIERRPDLVLSSPLPRALETAELTAKAFGCRCRVRTYERLGPGARVEHFIQALDAAGDEQDAMVVGHNPDLENFLAWLISTEIQVTVALKKGSLAVVGLAGGKRALKHPGGGRLLALYQAKALCRLAAKTP